MMTRLLEELSTTELKTLQLVFDILTDCTREHETPELETNLYRAFEAINNELGARGDA
jgi:hypothetical protein